MKNHYDYLITKYTAWLSLRNKTDNIYDVSTNTFNLSEEEWKLEILKNKNVESLKTTTLPFMELCAPLFDGTLSTGVKSLGPSSTEPRRVLEAHVVEDDEETKVVTVDSPTPPCSSRAPRPSVKTKKRELPPKPEPPSVEDCENKLNGLKWDEDDPLYETATAIFCDPNDHYRECWMKLKPKRMDDDLFTYEVKVANIPCDSKMDDDSEHEADDYMGYDPSDVAFIEWLGSKIFNYKTMDHYTMKALWIYWIRGDDEVELTDEEFDDEDAITEVFKIDTNIFDYETPLCSAFNEFTTFSK
ncbi:hypothetical protein Tco_0927225 [Tanacetum coccineum]